MMKTGTDGVNCAVGNAQRDLQSSISYRLTSGRDRSALFNAHPDNIFLVKATYWIAF
jgi:hypothetical protein